MRQIYVCFGAKADGAIGVKRHRSPSFAPWFQAYENPMDRGRGLGGAALVAAVAVARLIQHVPVRAALCLVAAVPRF